MAYLMQGESKVEEAKKKEIEIKIK